MKRIHAAIFALALLVPAPQGWGFPWDKDMVDQPAEKPQKSVAPPPPNSVPTTGRETLPAPTTENELFKAKDAAATLRNPVPATAESVARGAYSVPDQLCGLPRRARSRRWSGRPQIRSRRRST